MSHQDKSSPSLNPKFWWQQYSNSLSMALGKKSFLIRDILNSQDQSISTLPSNPSLIEWIIQNRVENFGQSFTCAPNHRLVNFEPECQMISGNDAQSFVCDTPESDDLNSNFALNPFFQNWLSIHRPTSKALNASPPNQTPTSSPPEKYQFSSDFCQNLYYYAIQQQISASLIGRFSSTDNLVVQSQSNSDLDALQSKFIKSKNTKSKRLQSILVSSQSVRKRPAAKPKKPLNKTVKKSKNLDIAVAHQTISEAGLDLPQGNDAQWTADSSECNCDVNDEETNGISNCGAKSKCKKLRRNRTVFTELQLMGLERRFDSQKYLSTPDRADLARALGLTQLQVKTWYQNRRMKWKKQVMQNGCPFPPPSQRVVPRRTPFQRTEWNSPTPFCAPSLRPTTATPVSTMDDGRVGNPTVLPQYIADNQLVSSPNLMFPYFCSHQTYRHS